VASFGFVHGAFHGAWCWEPLTTVLEELGHRTFTVDLPTEDAAAGAAEYAAAAVNAFAEAGDDLIVVGHSLGGLTIPLLPAERPVARLVFLCAMVARPGQPQDQVMQAEPDMIIPGPEGGAYVGDDGVVRFHADGAKQWFFSDCTPEQADWAAAQLRGQCWTIAQEVSPLTVWPDVPSDYVIGVHDVCINPEWSRRVARDVLGVEPFELDAGHSPFFSATQDLADLLISLA
jgi:pimeloyl-ACP methyl ester carboxylesterase